MPSSPSNPRALAVQFACTRASNPRALAAQFAYALASKIRDLSSSPAFFICSLHISSTKTTLNDLAQLIEKGFTAVAGDISDLRTELKDAIASVHEQVNSIEAQLRDTKIEIRLGHLEEKVFGSARR